MKYAADPGPRRGRGRGSVFAAAVARDGGGGRVDDAN